MEESKANATGLPDGKRVPPSTDIQNIKRLANALPSFKISMNSLLEGP